MTNTPAPTGSTGATGPVHTPHVHTPSAFEEDIHVDEVAVIAWVKANPYLTGGIVLALAVISYFLF